MEFIEAMKIKKRMCEDDIIDCIDCPLSDSNNKTKETCSNFIMLHPEEAEEIIKKWAEEHPQKTLLQDFLEKYPNAPIDRYGTPGLCPYSVGYSKNASNDCRTYSSCKECWNRPLEE